MKYEERVELAEKVKRKLSSAKLDFDDIPEDRAKPIKKPRKKRNTHRFYVIYNKYTDEILASGTKEECMKLLDLQERSWYTMVSHARRKEGMYEVEELKGDVQE